MDLNNLNDLYIEQLRDLYDAEDQLCEALPKMKEDAHHPQLLAAIDHHLQETYQHKARLEKVFESLGIKPGGESSRSMRGLIKDSRHVSHSAGDPAAVDAGIIAQLQRIEHYEIAGYGCVATYAQQLGRQADMQLLQQTLAEEKHADSKLNEIAVHVINPQAQKG